MFRINLLTILLMLCFTCLIYIMVWSFSEYSKDPEFYDNLCFYSVQVTEYYEDSQSVNFDNGFNSRHSAYEAYDAYVKTYSNTNLDSVVIKINRDCSFYETIADTTLTYCGACFPEGRGQ